VGKFKFNKYCKKCLLYNTKSDFGLRKCHGTEEYSSETQGMMHCYTTMTGTKKGDKIKNLEIEAACLKAKIQLAEQYKKKLKETEAQIRKLKGR
jgi:hypothetical protein